MEKMTVEISFLLKAVRSHSYILKKWDNKQYFWNWNNFPEHLYKFKHKLSAITKVQTHIKRYSFITFKEVGEKRETENLSSSQ